MPAPRAGLLPKTNRGSRFFCRSHHIYPAIMSDPRIEIPARAPAATSADDTILPFQVEALDLRGRVVRFGPAIDTILSRHRYPTPVAKLLGAADPGGLLGRGHLAMTIDQGPDTARYQGIVALEGKSLEHAAHEYFLRSEQIPTRVRLAVAEELRAGADGARHRWRAGGLLLQFLPKSPERARQGDLDPGDVPEGIEVQVPPEDDAWVEGRALVASVEDVELLDPNVSAERLLYRLFHQRGVRVFRSRDLHAQCSCSRERVERMLRSFSQDDRDHMVENGKITVTCEFCNSTYMFEPLDVREPTPSS